jgi:hypothetical protein
MCVDAHPEILRGCAAERMRKVWIEAPASSMRTPMTAADCRPSTWGDYARIIEGIRAKVDVRVYPSIPMGEGLDPLARFAHTNVTRTKAGSARRT